MHAEACLRGGRVVRPGGARADVEAVAGVPFADEDVRKEAVAAAMQVGSAELG